MKALKRLPSDYLSSIANGGKVVRLDYDTSTYDEANTPLHKFCYVYLPYGYTAERKYPVLYALHGGEGNMEAYLGNCEQSSPVRNTIDHMIANGDMEPLIVVSPTYYNQTSLAGDFSGAADIIRNFHNELSRDIIPAVEGRFSTYAKTTDSEGRKASRGQRAFTGFSMGSLATWMTFLNNLDEFAYFIPMSGDLWVNGANDRGLPGNAEAAADLLNASVGEYGYRKDDFFIYALTGDQDIAFAPMEGLIHAIRERADQFIFTEDDDEPGSIRWCVEPGAYHSYEFVPLYFYNALPCIFTWEIRLEKEN